MARSGALYDIHKPCIRVSAGHPLDGLIDVYGEGCRGSEQASAESSRWNGRAYSDPLDVAAIARVAFMSEAHFIRSFRATFGETPHRYLQRRRVERSMFLLRETRRSITDICMAVGSRASERSAARSPRSWGSRPASTESSRSRRRCPPVSRWHGRDRAVLARVRRLEWQTMKQGLPNS